MNVKFSFDKATVERRGFTLEDVYRTIKSLFAACECPCGSEEDVLSFTDKGHNDDFAVMWDIILSLLRADWFVECAASCVWQDEDGEEDILSQARSVGSRVYDRHPASLFTENEVNLSHPAGTVCHRRERSRVVSLPMRERAPPAHSNQFTAGRKPRRWRGPGPHRRGR